MSRVALDCMVGVDCGNQEILEYRKEFDATKVAHIIDPDLEIAKNERPQVTAARELLIGGHAQAS